MWGLLLRNRPAVRRLLSAAGIALGVALGYAVHLVNAAAVQDVTAAVRALAGEADLEVRGGRNAFPDTLYPAIARVPGVDLASPMLELDAGVAGAERALHVVALDILRAAALQPQFAFEGRLELLAPDRVFLSPAAADALKLGKGDVLRLVVGQKTAELRIAGVLPGSVLRGSAALMDIATAQWRLERLGLLNRIDIRLRAGADREAVMARVSALLPAGAHVSAVETLEQASAYPSRSYRVNMDVLAMVALFTGGFLVFSAQALEGARRRAEHALLRVLGFTRGQLFRLVLAESALLGAVGAALGLAVGHAVALAAVGAAGGDLGAGYFRGSAPRLGFDALGALGYFAAGIAVSVAGAILPARHAAHTPPARALKAGDEQVFFERAMPAWPGAILLAAGVGLAQLPPVNGLPLFGYVSIACLLLGSVMLMPRLAQLFFRIIPMPRAPAVALGIAQLRGAQGQAAVSLAAIVASFSLMAAMAIMVASFRDSVDAWLEIVLPADLYLRAGQGETGYLESGFEARLRGLPQVARADFTRSSRILLDPSRPPVVFLARDRAGKAYPTIGPEVPGSIWVSEAVSDLYGIGAGNKLVLPLGGRPHELLVAGVFRDYARQHGAILMDRERYLALTGDRTTNDAALWLAPGATRADLLQAIRALPGGAALDLADAGELREISLRIFDRSFAVTYAMEAVAVLVGLFGLSSSLGALVLARRREFGVLRHLGLTRRQIAGMLAVEGGVLAAIGVAAGLACGAAISLVLIHVVNRQSFNWSIDLHPPYLFLLFLSITLTGLAIATAILSGREAMGSAPVRAVREDW